MLQDNVQGIALDQAMRDANSQVQQIRDASIKDDEKQQAYRNVAQNFTMRLSGMGVAPDRIKAISESIAPAPPTTAEAGMMSNVPAYQQRGQQLMQQEQKNKLEQLGVLSGGKIRKEYDQQLTKGQERYAKVADKLNNSLKYASNIEQILSDPSRNPLEIGETLTQMPRAAGEVGRIPMQEREYFSGSMRIADQIDQLISKSSSSQFTDTNRQALLRLIQVYKQTANQERNNYARLVTGQLKSHSLFMDQSPESILHSVTGGTVNPQDVFGPSAQQGPYSPAPASVTTPVTSPTGSAPKKSYW